MNPQVAKLESLLVTIRRNRRSPATQWNGAGSSDEPSHESWADESAGRTDDLYPPYAQSTFDDTGSGVESVTAIAPGADDLNDPAFDLQTIPPRVAAEEPIFDEPVSYDARVPLPDAAFVSPFDAPQPVAAPTVSDAPRSADSLFPDMPSENVGGATLNEGFPRTPLMLMQPGAASGPIVVIVGGTERSTPRTFGELVRKALALRVR